MNCPVCGSESLIRYTLSKSRIISELEKYWQDKMPIQNNIIDYTICRCTNCTTEFSDPLIEGDDIFYEWITNKNGYYSSNRWEFFSIIKLIKNKKNINLLDVGCGDGKFLKLVMSKVDNSNIENLYGIDKTSGPVTRYVENAPLIKLFNRVVDDSLINDFENKFDYITLFHVLEHVSNPDYFISILLKLLSKQGKLIISTPNSPMTFEKYWFDIMNHPPHHMLRLNANSYKAIAKKHNLHVNFIYHRENLLSDLSSTLKLFYQGRFHQKKGLIQYFLFNPIMFFKIFLRSLFLKRSNTILVIFSKDKY